MPRDARLFLDDIIAACEKITRYCGDMTRAEFLSDERTMDAVVRNLAVIGEAASKVPEEMRRQSSEIDWQKIIAFRNILIHEYFGISMEIVWDVISNKIASLHDACARLLHRNGG